MIAAVSPHAASRTVRVDTITVLHKAPGRPKSSLYQPIRRSAQDSRMVRAGPCDTISVLRLQNRR